MRAFLVPAALVAVLAVAFQVVISRRARQGWRGVRAGMHTDIDRGGLHGLLRARLAGLRLALAESGDPDSAAALAYVGARLAIEHGVPSLREAGEAADRAERAGGANPVVAAARALIDLQQGQRAKALTRATAAASGATSVEPYLALAHARARSGDLLGASRALEAARVLAPGARDARVAWAELRIDLGDPAAAAEVLEAVVGAAPDDTEARLLLAESEDARGRPTPPAPLAASCKNDQDASPVLRAGCMLQRATAARLAGDRRRAFLETHAASGIAPPHPRLLARIAQLLAQLGSVDQAETLLAAAQQRGDQRMPSMAWARLAVALGRGLPIPQASAPASGSTTRILAARAAFASGGARALESWPPDPLGDPELRLYLSAARLPPDTRGPLADYLNGVRARLDGDLLLATVKLHGALDGHADSCRAAGEWIAATRALGRDLDLTALEPLRTRNAGCTHLSAASLAAPRPVRGKR
jgi:tetratricopeptide (TPR) repeat protein